MEIFTFHNTTVNQIIGMKKKLKYRHGIDDDVVGIQSGAKIMDHDWERGFHSILFATFYGKNIEH